VLLSSHILAEVEALCDRVSIIRNGRTVASGTLDSMRELTRTSVHAETERPPVGLDRIEGVHGLQLDRDQVRFDVDTVHLAAAIQCLTEAGIRMLVSTPPTLEELFLCHYGDTLDQ
jgi:ABC-2 type transport system ATP-binding protein